MSGSEDGTGALQGPEGDLEVFRRVYPAARRFAAFVAPAGTEPDDLVQEALARVLGRGPRAPLASLAEPLAYLRTTMLNIVRNEHRRLGREQAAFGRVEQRDETEDESDRVALAEEVLAALATLPARSRALVFLVDVEDQPIVAAARMVGVSPPTARTRLLRARRALRRHLELSEGVAR